MSEKCNTVLAIETSCDETGVAVMSKEGNMIKVLSQAISSQIDTHKKTGGVVPEVAAREHVTVIRPMIEAVLKESGTAGADLDAIAVTVGPGLMPALSVGVTAARTLAFTWQKPIIPVHHIEGHIYSALLNPVSSNKYEVASDCFPSLALIVSGGHTLLIRIAGHLSYEIIGSTRDDAAGEVFDKVARMLKLPYPGGPQISELATDGNPVALNFPRPMIDSGDFDFSFSGLKTAVLYALRDMDEADIAAKKADIAASFQAAVVDTLTVKVKQALDQGDFRAVLLAGGVAANMSLRQRMQLTAQENRVPLKVAPLALCGDNAVMIGQVGLMAFERGRKKTWQSVEPIARPKLTDYSI